MHSSIVLSFLGINEDDKIKQRGGCYIPGMLCQDKPFFSTRPTEHYSECLEYGHQWQRWKNKQSKCAICPITEHFTREQRCSLCEATKGEFEHNKLWCGNYYGKHRANSNECLTRTKLFKRKTADLNTRISEDQEVKLIATTLTNSAWWRTSADEHPKQYTQSLNTRKTKQT